MFYGMVEVRGGVDNDHRTVVTSFGAGPKPVISCTKNLRDDPGMWKAVSAPYCQWCMDLANPSNGRPTVTGWNEIHMRNCLVVDCTQAFEIWCKDVPPGVGFRRCSFKGNSTINVGGGWGALTRPNRQSATPLLVYSMETDTVDIDVSENTFENAPRGLIYKSGGLDTLPTGYRVHDNIVRGTPEQ